MKGRKIVKTSLLAFAASLCIGTVNASAVDVLYPSFENRLMKGQAIVIEGEDLIYGPDMEVIEDSLTGSGDRYKVSGGKALAFTDNPESYVKDAEQNPSFMVNFWAEDTSDYKIYLRIRPKDPKNVNKNGLLMYNVNDEGWKFRWNMNMAYGSATAPAYIWRTLVPDGQLAKSGNVCIKFKYVDAQGSYTSVPFIIDKIMISAKKNDTQALNPTLPEEGYFNEYTSNRKKISLKNVTIFPDAKQHPRVLITKEEIPALKEKLKHPLYANKFASIKTAAEKPVSGLLPSSNTEYRNNSGIISTLQARAFMYLIGEVDAAHADKTIAELKNYLATVTYDLENHTYMSRYAGDVTVVAACIYDWCYDRLTDVDKEFIRRRCYEWQKVSEVGYPPVLRNLVTGHGTEEQITYHQMIASIAFYDEDPDWYRLVAGTIFENMMPARNHYVSSGYGASFGSYFSARDSGFAMLNKMIKTLGYEDEIYHEKYPEVFNVLLYRSLPNGVWMKDGDDFIWSRYKADTKSMDSAMLMAYIGSEYNNPYLLRQGLLDYAWNSNNFSITDLFMIDPSKETKELDELPTTWKTTYPMTMMMARTGWQNGLNSDTAVAFMNGREVNIVDHQHRDAGTFQLYYKGMLAIDSGLYSNWGDSHHANYTSHTIAHNGMLIYDPEYETKYAAYYTEQTKTEDTPDGATLPTYVKDKFKNEDNDGGQRPFDTCGSYEDLINDNGKVDSDYAAKTLGTYIGPNSKTPAFSYLSTDLSLAYDYRTNGYRRSMVFMDLFNDDYPAAMIVYDCVNATDPTYKKTWLLHSEQEPTIVGNTTTITRTDNGQSGKLVNYTLLPQADNASITKVGGKGSEFLINGTNYMYNEASQNVFEYQHDSGAWRIELSPKAQANDDLFLNAMYVTDADGNLPQLPIIKEETATYAGAVVRDRMVTFSKSFAPISASFTLTIPENGYETMACLLTDMSVGKWKISGNNMSVCAESKEGEKCLYFTAAPGTYTVAPASASSAVTQFEAPEMTKATYGDFLIRKGNNLMYLPKPTKMVDGLPYVAVDGIMTQLGATVTEKTDTTVTVTMPSGRTAVLNKDSKNYTLNGSNKTLSHSVYWIDNEPYVYLKDFTGSTLLNLYSCSYSANSKLLSITLR